jgi:beta-glucosidase
MTLSRVLFAATALVAVAGAASAAQPWLDPKLAPDKRADLVLKQMTQDEKLTLLSGFFGSAMERKNYLPPAEARDGSAGYVPAIPRLGLPAQWQTDAGIGVATQGTAKRKRELTALPSGMATAATWNPDTAYRGGAMIGAEARASGFNVMLAGGANLAREPRNGRNFEYGGEDPLLAGTMVAAQVRGIQSNHVVSTIKHYALNDQETTRNTVDVRIDPNQARMSDLLAFEFAVEKSDPGSVMCSYNKVAGDWSCENHFLLTDVLRRDWGWKGFVMSDWGGVHSTAKAANAGLEQQSGRPFDREPYFAEPLKEAVVKGEVTQARLDGMARRVLWAMFAKGLVDHPVTSASMALPAADLAAHAAVTRKDAEEGAVLLKNTGGVLPLAATAKRIAVIGGHADVGVLSGGGSAQVYPVGGMAVQGLLPATFPGPVVYDPSAPLAAIRKRAPGAQVSFADGSDLAAAAKLAADCDIVLVFATQWTAEGRDASLTLPDNQNALIEAVAKANPRTVVVLETGGAVLMPWVEKVAGVLEAWYPGTAGGEAIGAVLFGEVDASGRLPISFPRDESQLARAVIAEKDASGAPIATYAEGAAVGYKWYDLKGFDPLFAFGHGLSYTQFAYDGLTARMVGGELEVSFRVRNTGARAGRDVPQIYVSGGKGWEAPKRLGGFKKVALAPGAATQVSLKVDPRLLAVFADGGWRIAPGAYKVQLGASSRDLKLSAAVTVPERRLPATYEGAR